MAVKKTGGSGTMKPKPKKSKPKNSGSSGGAYKTKRSK